MSGFIYFVTDGEGVKIGFARNVRARLKELQTSHHFPLFLLGAMAGSMAEERRLHKRFDRLRLRGEWFEPGTELVQMINELEAESRFVECDDIDQFRYAVMQSTSTTTLEAIVEQS